MVDIHAHIIPFVDDGARTIDDSITMIEHEIAIGVDTIIATPHHIFHRYEKSVEEINKNYQLLLEEVKKRNLNINILLGQEIYYSSREDIINLLKEKKLLTLDNTNKVLIEFSFTKEPEDLMEIIYNLSVNGYEVIVAHVERYEWMNIDKVIELRSEGALIQVNSDAVIGVTSLKEKRFVKKLLKNNLVDFIASDTHWFRPSSLDKAYKMVDDKILFEYYC